MKYSLPGERVEVKQTVDRYKVFIGKLTEQMPNLLAERRSPLWASRFMRRRIDYSDRLPDLKSYLYVGDLIAYDDKGRSDNVKFILTTDKEGRVTETGKTALGLIHSEDNLTSDNALPIIVDHYDSLKGKGIITLSRKDLGKLDEYLTEEETLCSRAWRIAARHPDEVNKEFAEDKNLLREYSKWVSSKTGEEKNMKVCFDSSSDSPKLRVLVVYWLGIRSLLYGRDNLDDDDGRLVGYLAPEASEVS